MVRRILLCTAMALALNSAHAADSIDLSRYTNVQTYAIPTLNGWGQEVSAVTYAKDRDSLFVVGDEGLGVIELSRTGVVKGTMAFDWTDTGSSNNDAEGLTYLGNGQLVVVDERPQIAYRFTFAAGGAVVLNNQAKAHVGSTSGNVGNVGTEGISVDPRDGTFFTVKQDGNENLGSPRKIGLAELRSGTIDFETNTATMTTRFSGYESLFGLDSLSDVQTLAPIDALAGTPAANNLLILSLDSRKLIEIKRDGTILSQLDLGFTTENIEGVGVDHLGTIFLVSDVEAPNGPSSLFVLTPVPEPETYALMAAGLGWLAWSRRRAAKRFAEIQ